MALRPTAAQHGDHRRDEPERQRGDDGQLLPPVGGQTVDPDFTRRFTWQIPKTSSTRPDQPAGRSEPTATYTVTLTSRRQSTRTSAPLANITITNPHPSASLGITGVTDTLGNGLNATVTCPAQSVPAGSTLVCTYQTNVPTMPMARIPRP